MTFAAQERGLVPGAEGAPSHAAFWALAIGSIGVVYVIDYVSHLC